jgi:hypothetical protein
MGNSRSVSAAFRRHRPSCCAAKKGDEIGACFSELDLDVTEVCFAVLICVQVVNAHRFFCMSERLERLPDSRSIVVTFLDDCRKRSVHSPLMFAALMIGHHRAISSF